MAKLNEDKRMYQVIADQNTRPRTRYLAEVLNLNPNSNRSRWNTRRKRVEVTMATSEIKRGDPGIDPETGEFRVVVQGRPSSR